MRSGESPFGGSEGEKYSETKNTRPNEHFAHRHRVIYGNGSG